MKINPYLTFNGNCREAMTFYKKCLGGILTFQTLGETPLSEKMPVRMKKAILNATLVKEQITLMASDMNENSVTKGNNTVSSMLHCTSETEIKTLYKKLSEDGKQKHPLEKTSRGAVMGALTDKYGNNWLLHYYYSNK